MYGSCCWLHRILASGKLSPRCDKLANKQYAGACLVVEVSGTKHAFFMNLVVLCKTERKVELFSVIIITVDVSSVITWKCFTFTTSLTIRFWICLAKNLIPYLVDVRSIT